MSDRLDRLQNTLDTALEDRPDEGIIRTNRRIFTDEDLSELEMKHLLEGNWLYLAHASQIPGLGDYSTADIGRQPAMLPRGKDGELNCLTNACSHRGAMLCR